MLRNNQREVEPIYGTQDDKLEDILAIANLLTWF